MISAKHYQVTISYDDSGLLVTVTHKPTGVQRTAYPREGESVRKTQMRLEDSIRREFFRQDEFQFEVGRCKIGEQVGGFHRVTHLPSGKARSANTITSRGRRHLTQDLLDALVEDLWHEGILPKAADPQ